MSEKGGNPDFPPPHEPPPSYSPPYPTGGEIPNPGYSAPQQYPSQNYGVPQAQYGQQYGQQQGQQYAMQQNTVVVAQPRINHSAVHNGYVPDHMGLAIFVTICCFWPLGIVAIMRASEARSALNRGDAQNAMLYSSQAKRYSMWALACGIISLVLAIVIVVAVVVTSINNNYYCYGCY